MKDDWRALPQRIESGLTTIQLAFGLVVLLFVVALLLATSTNLPSGQLLFDIVLWMAALILAGGLVRKLARWLRARSFGDMPPIEAMTSQDVLANAVSCLIGPLLLFWFAPRLLELRPESFSELRDELRQRWIDMLLIGIGFFLIAWPVRTFVRYVTRR